jgi:hypothetical protein
VQVSAILEKGGRVLNYAVVVLDVLDIYFEKLLAIVCQFLRFGDVNKSKQNCAHSAHNFVSLVEQYLIYLRPHDYLLLLLVLVDLHLLEDINCVFFLLRLQKHPAGNDRVQQVLEVFLGLAGPLEEVLLKLVVVFIIVLFVYFE